MEGFKAERVSVKEASEILGIPVWSIREWTRRGLLHIGWIYTSEGAKKPTFYLYKHLIDQELKLQIENPRLWMDRFQCDMEGEVKSQTLI